jgi:hypothetical protein
MKNKIYLEEKLTASDSTSKWISDFVKSDNPKFAGKSKKERIRMALGASYAAKGKGRNEEVEDISELKKSTLASYVNKAAQDKAETANTSGFRAGVKEPAYNTSDESDREMKRTKGISRAVSKLAKEEVEELDEISKKTLGSYVSKASVDMANRTADGVQKRALAGADYAHNISRGMDTKTADKHMKKEYDAAKPDTKRAVKRMHGIDRAVSRLTKESVKPEVEKAFPAPGVTKHAPVKGVSYMPKDKDKEKEKANSMKYGKDVKEEVEELDELSKSTLASYAKKATHDARMKMATGKDFERVGANTRKPEYKAGAKKWEDKYKSDARRREAGTTKAIDRLAKEEVELEEMDKSQPSSSRGAEGLPVGKKAEPAKTDKVKSDALKALQKAYKKEETELEEATPTAQQVKQAIGIARDKRYAQGNVTGAVKAMDKINKGLAQHPTVKKELQKQNEDIESVDEVKKATGGLKKACWKGYTAVGLKKKGGRMVPNCVPTKEQKELKTFKALREEINGN